MPKQAEPGAAKTKPKYKYYKVSFVIGKKADGSPDRIYVRGKTKAERDANLAEAKRLHARGLQQGELTVAEWSERWLSVYKANATPTQKQHYAAKLKNDILPVIGTLHMRDVRPSHLQSLLNDLSGGKKGTVVKIRQALCRLFDDAVYEGIIERDPSARLTLPEMRESPRRPLSEQERQILLEVAKKHPRGPWVLMMLYCGLRRGEGVALNRASVDLEHKRLTVSRAAVYRTNQPKLSTTKAAKLRHKTMGGADTGNRCIPIPDVLIPILNKLCEGKAPGELLFPKQDGKLTTKMAIKHWWKSFARQCHIAAGAKLYRNAIQFETSPFGEELTPHYLRHNYATDLYAAGIDEKARKHFLGHSSDDVTDRYTAMSEAAFLRAADLLNSYYAEQDGAKMGQ